MIAFFTPKRILRYVMMPEIGARLHALFMGGFGYVPYLIAVVYNMVGLLPNAHPYLLTKNVGRYGIRHVMAEALNHIDFSWKHIDRIILFFAVLAGLVLFFMQFIAMGAVLFLQPVAAMPTNWAGFFVVDSAYRPHDLAYMMLDMVFGVPHPSSAGGFFESCVSTSVLCLNQSGNAVSATMGTGTLSASMFGPLSPGAYNHFPFPHHLGLHRLLSIYSHGLLVIAMMIMGYFVVTVLAETAQSGTPFGRRFNKTWAPLRVVMAFGLLMPLTTGLNSSQYIVLYAAKYGSAFATNGWKYFNDTLTGTYLGGGGMKLISVPNTPELGSLAEFMYVAKTCQVAMDHYNLEQKRDRENDPTATLTADERIQMHVIRKQSDASSSEIIHSTTTYSTFLGYVGSDKNRVSFRFGTKDPKNHSKKAAFVGQECGELQMTLMDPRPSASAEPGPFQIQKSYYELTRSLWHDSSAFWSPGIGGQPSTPYAATQTPAVNKRYMYAARLLLPDSMVTAHPVGVDSVFVRNVEEHAIDLVSADIKAAVLAQIADPDWAPSASVTEKGWAAGGIWYNRISEMNGEVTAAAYSIPRVTKYPYIMEQVAEKKAAGDKDVPPAERFRPVVVGAEDLNDQLSADVANQLSGVLYNAYKTWNEGSLVARDEAPRSNPFLAAISQLLGTDGLYNMRENPDTHPLAMLSGIGRSLVESSIQSLGYAAIATGLNVLGTVPKQLAQLTASFFITVAMLGLIVGFVLFYVIPFLPFIYFFFGVGGWIKGIFEALVGAPLWALAHIRIDGHGLPGSAAMNGYFLVFEVFLRPILIVFGLLASISTYSALVSILNNVFDLVVQNVSGYDVQSSLLEPSISLSYMRSLVDEFFYTVIYAIIVYMMGMASFKLIDSVPNNILRWMGQSVASFGDQRDDPAQGLVSRSSIGSQQAISKVGGGLSTVVSAANK